MILVPVDPEKRYLYFQLLGGKAFLEHLQDPEDIPGNIASTFTIHVHFNGQRYSSKAVSCACEPAFEEGISFKKFFICFRFLFADVLGLLTYACIRLCKIH